MKRTTGSVLGLIVSFALGFYFNGFISKQVQGSTHIKQTNKAIHITKTETMKLGAFSVSLSVKDLSASKQFYENLGFTVLAGNMKSNYLIMKNEKALIGLFQGMFKNNILTFNPGWDENGKNIEGFDDIREIQRQLKGKGVSINQEVDEKTQGPASFMITDPDGNAILFDQHR